MGCPRILSPALVLSLWLTLPGSARAGEVLEPFEGRVVRVLDGDTVEVLTLEGERRVPVKVRLHGVDCPEKRQPFGQKAKEAALRLAGGQQVSVVPRDRDRYGRTVGVVRLPDGRSLNAELVRLGLAWWYRRYAPRARELEELEAQARAARLGLWADPSPQAPWDFRKAQRGERRGRGKHRR
ncbi:MAG TPA: thermonuclease family protein [Myxococcota bacterium]|nr:thermonuclease family protein [Myxococcota bacterium]HRY93221.1 thermonuclease family protein [Myxococcota bacterium]HSA21012.1 thermonuclease family protein [Myxococcota bacterium]